MSIEETPSKNPNNRSEIERPFGRRYYCAHPSFAGRGGPDVFGEKIQKKLTISLRL